MTRVTHDYLEQHTRSINDATKNPTMTDKLVQAAKLALFENPSLARCEPSTVLRALVEAGRLGLVPDALGHCYLVPRGKRASLDIGYRGYIWLAHQSDIWPIEAGVVRDGDEFEVVKGTSKALVHRPSLSGGEPIAFYAIATVRKGGLSDKVFEVLTADEVAHIRDTYSKSSKAWNESFSEMGKKTAIRRLVKNLPMSTRLQDAFTVDGVEQRTDDEVMAVEESPAIEMKVAAADQYLEALEGSEPEGGGA
jgi:recombination protein RecT